MTSADYTFDLPPELVAQDPPTVRGESRLLLVDRGGGVGDLRSFTELPDLLNPGDLLVCNDSRVLPARLWTRRVDTGGRIELLLLSPDRDEAGAWLALARPSRRLRSGQVLAVTDPGSTGAAGPELAVLDVRTEGLVLVRESRGGDLVPLAEKHGDIPLPPYIRRDPAAPGADRRRQRDRERYQTVYARVDEDGASVAAPTAGLHFDEDILARLASRGVGMAAVTLHVGPGTFRPPTAEQIAAGRLHAESFHCPAATTAALTACRRRGGRVYAVGTTSLRVLETVARLELPATAADGDVREFPDSAEGSGSTFVGRAAWRNDGWQVAGTTRLFIQPPDTVDVVDGLVTNFHLPGSSLLRLVAAFAGETTWRDAYRQAVARKLRFYSYGDAMLIRPARTEESP